MCNPTNMCGVLLMNLNPSLQSIGTPNNSTTTTKINNNNRRSPTNTSSSSSSSSNSSSCRRYDVLPATKAVNELLGYNSAARAVLYSNDNKMRVPEVGFAPLWPNQPRHGTILGGGKLATDASVNKETSNKSSRSSSGGLWDLENTSFTSEASFPNIEWNFSDEEEEEEERAPTALRGETMVNQARLYREKAPRRASLVRSISLVSSIVKEMQDTEDANNKTRPFSSISTTTTNAATNVFKRRRIQSGSSPRFMSLSPTKVEGLMAGRHEGAEKFFL